MDLTKRQQEIFDFIRRYSAKYGYPPTVRDIGKAVGLASSSTVHAHLANLEKIGLLRRERDDQSEDEGQEHEQIVVVCRRSSATDQYPRAKSTWYFSGSPRTRRR